MDSFPGTDGNVWGTAQGPTHSSLSQVFLTSAQVLSSSCTLDGSREEYFPTSTQELFPRCALDGRREKRFSSDLHSGVIPKLHTRWQQRRASPGDLRSGVLLKVHTRWQQRDRPCLKGSARFTSKRESRSLVRESCVRPSTRVISRIAPLCQRRQGQSLSPSHTQFRVRGRGLHG